MTDENKMPGLAQEVVDLILEQSDDKTKRHASKVLDMAPSPSSKAPRYLDWLETDIESRESLPPSPGREHHSAAMYTPILELERSETLECLCDGGVECEASTCRFGTLVDRLVSPHKYDKSPEDPVTFIHIDYLTHPNDKECLFRHLLRCSNVASLTTKCPVLITQTASHRVDPDYFLYQDQVRPRKSDEDDKHTNPMVWAIGSFSESRHGESQSTFKLVAERLAGQLQGAADTKGYSQQVVNSPGWDWRSGDIDEGTGRAVWTDEQLRERAEAATIAGVTDELSNLAVEGCTGEEFTKSRLTFLTLQDFMDSEPGKRIKHANSGMREEHYKRLYRGW